MIVTYIAQPARIEKAVAGTPGVRTQANIAAQCRRALIRNELLLAIAAAPRPAVGDTGPLGPSLADPGRPTRSRYPMMMSGALAHD